MTRIGTEDCPLCGTLAYESRDVTDVCYGVRSVRVETSRMICTSCNESFSTPEQLEATDERAAAIVRAEGSILGFEIRRLRKGLGYTQVDFEDVLGMGRKTITRWERDQVILEGPTVVTLRALESGELRIEDIMSLRTGRSVGASVVGGNAFKSSEAVNTFGSTSNPDASPASIGYVGDLAPGFADTARTRQRTLAPMADDNLALAA